MNGTINKLAENVNKNEFLSDVSKPDSKWDTHRANTQKIGEIYNESPDFQKIAKRMSECSSVLGFGENIDTSTGEIKYKLKVASFCKVRLCPVCSWRRSLKNTARFFSKLPLLEKTFPKHRWIFLTLTVKNCEPEELKETLKNMNAAWKRLIERSNWPAEGWVRSTEVTRADDGGAHPHFHCLLMVPASYFAGHSYVTQATWAQRWRDALRADYSPMVDVRAVKTKHEGQTIQAAIVETLKYSVKVTDAFQDKNWLYAITSQLHKMRFIATGGALKGLFSEDLTDDEMIKINDDKTEESSDASLFFSWRPTIRRYKKKGVL